MPREVIAWDSCIIIDAIGRTHDRVSAIDPMLRKAEAGNLQIVVSMASVAEVVYLGEFAKTGMEQNDQNDLIRRWFDNEYVILRNVDFGVGLKAAELSRQHKGMTPLDSIVLATAILSEVTTLVTYDNNTRQGRVSLLGLDGKLGDGAPRILPPEDYTIEPQFPFC